MSSGYTRDREHFPQVRYQFRFYCRDCGHQWKKSIATEDPLGVRTPPCPKCRKAAKDRDGLSEIITSGRAPAIGGANVQNRALDMAAEMVMQDYGMTDVKAPTDIRAGESQTPPIPRHLQQQADSFFSPRKALAPVGMDRFAPLIARGALSGAISPKATGSPDPIAAAQKRHEAVMDRTTILNEGQKNG